ncbi:conserved hypothetical protein [Paraburkholderia tropica]|uniref:hypothetical protein n=1 Tax=Paraburkholderia TaxID=1822464 RepID=UPI001CAE979E|nr:MULTISPECIES: hypothetical protein [Paraburkholderia]CAG9201578.1 conserved hypothetical protein [Paraburkholderia tropica]
MAIHYAAVAGDPLDSGPGSYVLDYGRHDSVIEGPDGLLRNMALLGDGAYCSRCDSVGHIIGGAAVKDDNRMLFEQYGRRQAVGEDYVACRCSVHPRIVATFGRNWELVDWIAETTAARYGSSDRNFDNGASRGYNERYRIKGGDGQALAGIRYRIVTDWGRVFTGITNTAGETDRIATNGSEKLRLYAAGDAAYE